MIDSAIIDFSRKINYKEEILFKLKRLDKKVFIKNYYIEEKEIYVIDIPLSLKSFFNNRRKNNLIKDFIKFLKNQGIKKVILTDNAKKIENLEEKIRENFHIFDGKSVINFCFSNIIKKYIIKNKNENCELVFLSNNFEEFYYYFKKIFSLYRTGAIVTLNKESFLKFSDIIYRDYGIFISVYDMENYKYKDNHIIINIDTNFFENKIDIDLNEISILFNRCEKLKFIYNYFNYIDEKILEFVAYNIFKAVKKSNLTELFTDFDIRIVKINKKQLTI